jgi:hypothetical protein
MADDVEVDVEELVRTLEDLLTIAKVAMPTELYEVDPRIIRAEALLAKLEGQVQ